MIAVSLVSHGHGAMVEDLAGTLLACPDVARLIITLNVPEQLDLPIDCRVTLIANDAPKGFGTNHNAAFAASDQPLLCVINPDISFEADPFPPLQKTLQTTGAAMVAPLVLSPEGALEDSARRFPNLGTLLAKAISGERGAHNIARGGELFSPDWVAGMFMLFRREAFAQLNGFDETYFMYYEDVDLCARLRQAGENIAIDPRVEVVHNAQRASHRNARHMRWHLTSLTRYLLRYRGGFLLKRSGATGHAP